MGLRTAYRGRFGVVDQRKRELCPADGECELLIKRVLSLDRREGTELGTVADQ